MPLCEKRCNPAGEVIAEPQNEIESRLLQENAQNAPNLGRSLEKR